VTRKSDDLPLTCSVLDIEAGELNKAQKEVWQTDISLGSNHSWAYSPDAISRPVNQIVDEIVARKSMNGVTLLSLAPKADGTLPPSQIKTMKKLGKWMSVNKEALYASRPAPFVEGGTDEWESGTIRFTEKGTFLYAIELGNERDEGDDEEDDEDIEDEEEDEVEDEDMEDEEENEEEEEEEPYPDSTPPSVPYVIPGVKPVKDSKIVLLGHKGNLLWHQEGDDVVIEKLPEPLPGEYAWSFKIQVR